MGTRNLTTFHTKNFDFLAPEGYTQEYLVKDGWAGFVLYDREQYEEYEQSDCYIEVYNIIEEDISRYIDDQVAIHGYEQGFSHKVKPIKEVELRYLCFEGEVEEKKYEAYYVYDFNKGIQIRLTVKGDVVGTAEFAEKIFISFQSNIEYQKVFHVEVSVPETPKVEEPSSVVPEPVIEKEVPVASVAEEPVVEKEVPVAPVVEEPVVEKEVPVAPVAEEPVVEKEVPVAPVAEEPVVEKEVPVVPVVEEPVVEKEVPVAPIIEKPVVEVAPEPVEFVSFSAFQLREQLEEVTQKINAKVEELNIPYKEAQRKLDELTNQERDFISQKSDLSNEIANTGIFKASHKKELQLQVQEIDAQLVENRKIYETTRSQMNQFKKNMNEEKAALELMEQVYDVRISYMEGERGITNQEFINDMFYVITKANRPINADDIRNSSEVLKDMDSNKFITLLRSMMVEDRIEKVGDGPDAKYKLIRRLM